MYISPRCLDGILHLVLIKWGCFLWLRPHSVPLTKRWDYRDSPRRVLTSRSQTCLRKAEFSLILYQNISAMNFTLICQVIFFPILFMKYNQVWLLVVIFSRQICQEGDEKYHHPNHLYDTNMLCTHAAVSQLRSWFVHCWLNVVKSQTGSEESGITQSSGRWSWTALLVSVLIGSFCIITNIATQR